MENLLYAAGEAIAVYVEEVEEVTYPPDNPNPDTLFIRTADGKRYELKLRQI